jgi:hypothetical protein
VNKKRKDKEDKETASENGGGDVEIEGLDAEQDDESDDVQD